MNVYIYYSKASVQNFKNPVQLEEKIAESALSCAKDASLDVDVKIFPARLNQEDVHVVVDKRIDTNPLFLGELKERIQKILKEDQNSQKDFEIGIECDTAHKPVFESAPHKEGKSTQEESEFDYEKLSRIYIPEVPNFSFDRVILPEETKKRIEESLATIQYRTKIFEEWGLYEIQPSPSSSLNFYGPSGTGKTMAAEAVASKLGKKILKASYADIESKYHGEGPKMVKAIFLAAEKNDAVLFIDEADSLLSKRLTSVSSGSDQAINSMRSELLQSLEKFKGISIFATNLNQNYDPAFLTRLINIKFTLPDEDGREKIWNVHLHGEKLHIPLSEDVDTKSLAHDFPEFSGREIRNTVILACTKAAMENKNEVAQKDFEDAAASIVEERKKLDSDDAIKAGLKEVCKEAVAKKNAAKEKQESAASISEQ